MPPIAPSPLLLALPLQLLMPHVSLPRVAAWGAFAAARG
eukprot:CAMPEP_0198238304 /NCGR_PEP_ID=MMETSP1446-20131203/3989_1 /TAXON_ID=1461542 ORGANISM="Unidentified sp, Strain CCMP2111" /NCGR_SAMPLE_ID=MMETSP1446 /ASSEMBLY_ACC=CAM_ASM_001112 /LENGTH=38 /DNA_ID= /DNA_START= /DNA_END= /DNA_ORIENTATION=